MFEEVPRTRRGLAALATRPIVLGPFVVGGGLLLAAIGGSVAVAATVITASSIHSFNDVPPRSAPQPAQTSRPAAAHRHGASTAAPSGSSAAVPAQAEGRPAAPGAVGSSASPGLGAAMVPSQATTPDATWPAGNALVHVDGLDRSSQRLLFQFAVASSGPGGVRYQAVSPREYSAALAGDLSVVSAGGLCGPAGQRCTVRQLATAAARGFYAVAAIDPSDRLHSLIEVDAAGATFGPVSSGPGAPAGSGSPPSSAAPSAAPASTPPASSPAPSTSPAGSPSSKSTAAPVASATQAPAAGTGPGAAPSAPPS